MKVDLRQPINNLDGTQMKGVNDELLTLGGIVDLVLGAAIEEDRGISADKVTERWKLALRVFKKEEAEFSADEMVLIRNRIPKVVVSPIAAGQACEMMKG